MWSLLLIVAIFTSFPGRRKERPGHATPRHATPHICQRCVLTWSIKHDCPKNTIVYRMCLLVGGNMRKWSHIVLRRLSNASPLLYSLCLLIWFILSIKEALFFKVVSLQHLFGGQLCLSMSLKYTYTRPCQFINLYHATGRRYTVSNKLSAAQSVGHFSSILPKAYSQLLLAAHACHVHGDEWEVSPIKWDQPWRYFHDAFLTFRWTRSSWYSLVRRQLLRMGVPH